MMNLNGLSIAYIDSLDLEQLGSRLRIVASTSNGLKNVSFLGLISLNVSRDLLDLDVSEINV